MSDNIGFGFKFIEYCNTIILLALVKIILTDAYIRIYCLNKVQENDFSHECYYYIYTVGVCPVLRSPCRYNNN